MPTEPQNEILEDDDRRGEFIYKHGMSVAKESHAMDRLELGQPSEIKGIVEVEVELDREVSGLLKKYGAAIFEEVAKLLGGEE